MRIFGRAATAALLALVLVFIPPPAARPDDHAVRGALDVVSQNGTHRFMVEVASDDATRARGLMFRATLGDDEGMLFTYADPRAILMWMRSTYVPLDMLFIGTDGRVSHINSRAEPLSEAVISSDGEVQGVIEIKGGRAAELGIGVGDQVQHPSVKHPAE